MGFHPPRKLSKLVFPEDSDLHGLEIIFKAATLAEDFAFNEGYPDKETSGRERVRYVTEYFLRRVTYWNLEDEHGEPVPVTYDAYEEVIPMEWHNAILEAFRARSLGNKVSESTEKKSEPGEPTETTPLMEASLPMESLP